MSTFISLKLSGQTHEIFVPISAITSIEIAGKSRDISVDISGSRRMMVKGLDVHIYAIEYERSHKYTLTIAPEARDIARNALLYHRADGAQLIDVARIGR